MIEFHPAKAGRIKAFECHFNFQKHQSTNQNVHRIQLESRYLVHSALKGQRFWEGDDLLFLLPSCERL